MRMTNESLESIFYTTDGRLKPNVSLLADRFKEYGLDIEALGEDEVNQILKCFIVAARDNSLSQRLGVM